MAIRKKSPNAESFVFWGGYPDFFGWLPGHLETAASGWACPCSAHRSQLTQPESPLT